MKILCNNINKTHCIKSVYLKLAFKLPSWSQSAQILFPGIFKSSNKRFLLLSLISFNWIKIKPNFNNFWYNNNKYWAVNILISSLTLVSTSAEVYWNQNIHCSMDGRKETALRIYIQSFNQRFMKGLINENIIFDNL